LGPKEQAVYVVTVEFMPKAEYQGAFKEALLVNARASREREPGCRQFDVVEDPKDPAALFLYEVYDDASAFDAHVASAHFRAFDRQVRDWVASKTVRILTRIDH